MSLSHRGLNALVDVSPTGDVCFCEATDEAQETQFNIQLHFFSEGAANVLFRISPSEKDVGDDLDVITGCLLRLRKAVQVALKNSAPSRVSPPPFISAEETYNHIYGNINLDKSLVLDYRLVTVSQGLIRQCNDYLAHTELLRTRDPRRVGGRLEPEVNSALLVKDMTSYDSNSVTIELKPKWLSASPGVKDARRCRTCAWHVKNNISRESRYCPHALLSKNQVEVRKQVKSLLPQMASSSIITRREAEEEITSFFCNPQHGFQILQTLREQQEANDSQGVLSWVRLSDKDDPKSHEYFSYLEDLAKDEAMATRKLECAMTLRDCTLFIKLKKQRDGRFEIDAKIGDLDPKLSTPLKLAKWVSDEYNLRERGYYHGTEAESPRAPTDFDEICIHWRESNTA